MPPRRGAKTPGKELCTVWGPCIFFKGKKRRKEIKSQVEGILGGEKAFSTTVRGGMHAPRRHSG